MPLEIAFTLTVASMIAPDSTPTWSEVVIRLVAATGIGGAIGLNRELTRKPAGLRTHALVALGSALVTVTALQLGVVDDATHANAVSRVIQGVIAGIGFLGGGVILHTDGRNVIGLTTAATIWVAAALGVSCGIGQWKIAAVAVGIALAVLVLGRPRCIGVNALRAILRRSERVPFPSEAMNPRDCDSGRVGRVGHDHQASTIAPQLVEERFR